MINQNTVLIVAGILLSLFSCSSKQEESEEDTIESARSKRPISLENGKIFSNGGIKYLYGGPDSLQHFDITNSELKDAQYHYGIGREAFPALLTPSFTTVDSSKSFWHDSTRFLVAYSGTETKAYSIPDLTRHEVVNDIINGIPILPAYCILADLGAIYDRRYGEHVLTFALSGYTYYDPDVWGGLDGFILWDRDTESLWWPLVDRSVSGPLKGVALRKFDELSWKETTWEGIKTSYPEAMVLAPDQDFERPQSWGKITDVTTIVETFRQE